VLVDQARLFVVQQDKVFGDLAPAGHVVGIQTQLSGEVFSLVFREARVVPQVGGSLKVPAGHVVGEGVIIDVNVELIRSHGVADLEPAVRVARDPAGPEAGGLEDNFRSLFPQKVFVPGHADVLIDGKRHVGRDMVLDIAAPDAVPLARCQISPAGWAGLVAGVGAFPCVLGTAIVVGPRLATCPVECRTPISQQGLGAFRVGQGKERQHVDFGVPEDVSAVMGAAKAFGADADDLARLRAERGKLEEVEADGPLILDRSVDLDVHSVPEFRAGDQVVIKLLVPSALAGSQGSLSCLLSR